MKRENGIVTLKPPCIPTPDVSSPRPSTFTVGLLNCLYSLKGEYSSKDKLSKIAISCGIPSKSEKSIASALKKIGKENNDAIIFCTGSLYFIGEILNLN